MIRIFVGRLNRSSLNSAAATIQAIVYGDSVIGVQHGHPSCHGGNLATQEDLLEDTKKAPRGTWLLVITLSIGTWPEKLRLCSDIPIQSKYGVDELLAVPTPRKERRYHSPCQPLPGPIRDVI